MGEVITTDEELKRAIQKSFPDLSGTGQNILRLDVLLRSRGSSLEKVLDGMKVEGSPFLKLPSRD